MTYNDALRHKKQFLRDSSTFTKSLYHCLITPAIPEESQKYISLFTSSPSSYIDESCKLHCTNAEFKVVVLPKKNISSANQTKEAEMSTLEQP
ncbi:hypothetical protein VUJ46_11265 [Chryseobacterium sp. MYb264]|uniref:hypothetical protein n=1 Tax=Chryseobacterium sp. MYb264 TaxID=2745153 RepID=UPI002E101D36|nr:hypothetical protein VUJ46_11265 [Chryseobacterium sp. MYb264]